MRVDNRRMAVPRQRSPSRHEWTPPKKAFTQQPSLSWKLALFHRPRRQYRRIEKPAAGASAGWMVLHGDDLNRLIQNSLHSWDFNQTVPRHQTEATFLLVWNFWYKFNVYVFSLKGFIHVFPLNSGSDLHNSHEVSLFRLLEERWTLKPCWVLLQLSWNDLCNAVAPLVPSSSWAPAPTLVRSDWLLQHFSILY